jgi:hypothetical protein
MTVYYKTLYVDDFIDDNQMMTYKVERTHSLCFGEQTGMEIILHRTTASIPLLHFALLST